MAQRGLSSKRMALSSSSRTTLVKDHSGTNLGVVAMVRLAWRAPAIRAYTSGGTHITRGLPRPTSSNRIRTQTRYLNGQSEFTQCSASRSIIARRV